MKVRLRSRPCSGGRQLWAPGRPAQAGARSHAGPGDTGHVIALGTPTPVTAAQGRGLRGPGSKNIPGWGGEPGGGPAQVTLARTRSPRVRAGVAAVSPLRPEGSELGREVRGGRSLAHPIYASGGTAQGFSQLVPMLETRPHGAYGFSKAGSL